MHLEVNNPFLLSRCAVITEFARELLAQRGVKVVVPGEQERVVVSLSEETNEAEAQAEEKNGSEEPAVKAAVGEKCEVCKSSFSAVAHQQTFIAMYEYKCRILMVHVSSF